MENTIIFTEQGRQVRYLRKFALVLSLTTAQVLIIFPLLICAKLYFYPEIYWSWLLAFPQLSAAIWLLLTPYNRIRFLGFLLLSTPTFVALGIQSPGTYWGCHAALFPFYFGLLGRKRFPLGLVLASQLHLECFLSLFGISELIKFPRWPSPLGIATFFALLIGTALLPLAVISVAYLIHQTTKPIILVGATWIILCVFLSLNAVNAVNFPIYSYAILLSCMGLCVTIDGLMIYVSWRTRLTGIVWPFISEPVLPQSPQRSSVRRGLTSREISELPVLVINRNNISEELPYDSVCTICQDSVEEGRPALLLPACQHVFHPKCCIQWLRRKPVCPNCNLDVREGIASTRASLNGSITTDSSGENSSTQATNSSRRSTARNISSLLGTFVTGNQSRYRTPGAILQTNRNTVPLSRHSSSVMSTASFSGTNRRIPNWANHPNVTESNNEASNAIALPNQSLLSQVDSTSPTVSEIYQLEDFPSSTVGRSRKSSHDLSINPRYIGRPCVINQYKGINENSVRVINTNQGENSFQGNNDIVSKNSNAYYSELQVHSKKDFGSENSLALDSCRILINNDNCNDNYSRSNNHNDDYNIHHHDNIASDRNTLDSWSLAENQNLNQPSKSCPATPINSTSLKSQTNTSE